MVNRLSNLDAEELNHGEQGSSLIIQTPKEFQFSEALVYLARSPQECLYHVQDNKVQKLLQIGDETVLFEVAEAGPTWLEIRFVHGVPTTSVQFSVAAYVRDWFDLQTDVIPFYEMAGKDSLLAPLVKEFFGLRVVGIPDLFEVLCWAIIGQQINLAFAYTLKRRFVETFGHHEEWEGRTYWLFPSVQVVSGLSVDDLMPLQFSARKAEYVITVAQQMAAGLLTKDKLLACGDFRQMERELVHIRGIGHWSANYALMRCLRDPSAFPIADVGLHNAMKQQLGLNKKPTIDEIRELASGWSGWEAYATFYLWRSLQ